MYRGSLLSLIPQQQETAAADGDAVLTDLIAAEEVIFLHAVGVEFDGLVLVARVDERRKAPSLVDKGILLLSGVHDLKITLVHQLGICLSQSDQRFEVLVDTAAHADLILDGGVALAVVERQIEHILVRVGKAEVLLMVPLHRGARAGAREAALLRDQVGAVAHADLVAVVDEGYARHRHDEGVAELYHPFAHIKRRSGHIVIVGDEADVAVILRAEVGRHIIR